MPTLALFELGNFRQFFKALIKKYGVLKVRKPYMASMFRKLPFVGVENLSWSMREAELSSFSSDTVIV